MTYKIKHFLLLVVLLVLIAAGTFVFGYYITASEPSDYQNLSLTFLLIVMLYIAGQLTKRFLQEKAPWYGWLYYIGLISVVAPLPLIGLMDDTIIKVTRFGSLFLILPPLIEFVLLVRKKEPAKAEKEKVLPDEEKTYNFEKDENDLEV